jgi:hypothetical protein
VGPRGLRERSVRRVGLRAVKGVGFRIYGTKWRGKRAVWLIIRGKRRQVGAICDEKYPDKRGNGPGQSSKANPLAGGATPATRGQPPATGERLPPPENGHRGSLTNTAPYALRAGLSLRYPTAIPWVKFSLLRGVFFLGRGNLESKRIISGGVVPSA